MRFKNVVAPIVGSISREEMDLLLIAMTKVLESEDGGAPKRGSIVLYEQRRGEDEECVFALNMEEGEMNNFPCKGGAAAPSEYMADRAIRELALWPEEGAFELHGKRRSFGQLETGIYHGHDDYFAMSLNTTLGRFLVSSYVDFAAEGLKELKSKNEIFLVMIAEVMRRLRLEDRALNHSVKGMWELYWYSRSNPEVFAEKMQVVKKTFSDKDLPELKLWREWREEQKENGGIQVFFDGYTEEDDYDFSDYDYDLEGDSEDEVCGGDDWYDDDSDYGCDGNEL